MKVVVTGGGGQLGQALFSMRNENVEIVPLTVTQCDVTDEQQVYKTLEREHPDVVIHCAAYTAVAKAEAEPELCRKVNVLGTMHVANACKLLNSTMVLLSSDYVFDGIGSEEQPTDKPRRALNRYGQSKIDAENIVMALPRYYIIRTSWMFGSGANFVDTISELGRKQKTVFVVDDQIGSPTYAEDLAKCLLSIIEKVPYGVYHVTNEGYCSWAELTEVAFRMQKISATVHRISSQEYGGVVKRPQNSRLSKECLDKYGVARLPQWEDGLRRYLEKRGLYCGR